MKSMTKKEVEEDILSNLRYTRPASYYWKGNQLWCEETQLDLFGGGEYKVNEPVTIRWCGEPVEIIE